MPCICWQEQADEVAQWQQGDTVELLGRYQSRQYEKVLIQPQEKESSVQLTKYQHGLLEERTRRAMRVK